jgi:uncharacterized lipoprotein YmbA
VIPSLAQTVGLAGLTAILFGCVGSEALPSRYTLTSRLPPSAARRPSNPEISVLVRPAQVPLFLMPLALTVRRADNRVEQVPDARWAEPLDRGISRVMAENLEGLGVSAASLPIAGQPPSARYAVTLRLDHFEGSRAGDVAVQGTWDLALADSDAALLRRTFTFSTLYGAPGDYAALVRALSTQLGEVSARVAQTVRAKAHRSDHGG